MTPREYTENRKEENRGDILVNELSIEEFKEMLEGEAEIIVYDVREADVYAKGHVRDAILWEVPFDKAEYSRIAETIASGTKVVFYCDFGSRSYEIGSLFGGFHPATYVVNDTALRWLEDHYLDLSDGNNEMYGYTFKELSDPDELVDSVHDGAVLVDPRPSAEYQAGHFTNSRNIPITDLTYDTFANLLKTLSPPNGVSIICHDRKSCDEAYLLSYVLDTWSQQRFSFTRGIYRLDK